MLDEIRFKFGSVVGAEALTISTPPSITVFVGPNNSGKSQALRDLNAMFHGVNSAGTSVIDSITFPEFSEDGAKQELNKVIVPAVLGETQHPGHVFIKTNSVRHQIPPQIYINALINPNNSSHRPDFANYYAGPSTLSLDGPSRVSLTYSQSRGDLKNPSTAFARLLMDDERRAALRSLVHDATGLHFVLDASEGDQLSVRFGLTEPPNERSLEDTTLDYMRNALDISRVSDGVKAFTGILIQLHVGRPRVITVDEPEAFLHPNLAFTLGKELARGAVDEGKHVFVATHSAQFLMGAIASGAEVNIVRLTYKNGIGSARLLPSVELRRLMHDPLLRSAGVLDGLFYDAVVVGEANADRAFYQEINERLLNTSDARATPRTLFLNADSKHTIPRIVAPLRQLGIPAAGVVDIDVLKDGGAEWTRFLQAICIPNGEHSAYAARRQEVLGKLNATGLNFKTQGGIGLLQGADRETAENLLRDLESYGLFTVPIGEVEAWLADLNVERNKQKWLRSIFEAMGSDPSLQTYVRPINGDVWDFMGRVASWAKNPNRRGIPI
jgi:predicted ATPase